MSNKNLQKKDIKMDKKVVEYYDSVANVVEKVVKGEYCLVNPQKLRRTKYFKEQYPTDSIN